MIEHEELYDVLINGQGELLFSIKVRDEEPKSSKLIYDGGEHALFYRITPGMEEIRDKKPPQMILFDYLHEDIRPTLNEVASALIMEVDHEQELIMRAYKVPVIKVSKLPLPPSELPTPPEE